MTFRPWSDAFCHATWIRSLAEGRSILDAGHDVWIDQGGEFYAFGQCVVPAELVRAAGVPSLDAALALWADGVFAHEPGSRVVTFCEQEEVTDADVAKLARAIRDRVMRALRRTGKWPAATDPADGGDEDSSDDVLRDLGAAAVQGLAALGELAGARDVRVGRGTRNEPLVKGPERSAPVLAPANMRRTAGRRPTRQC